MKKKLRVVAILATRNEEIFIQRCLEHLTLQGVDVYLLDNESTDKTVEIAEKFINKGIIGIEKFSFTGKFNLTKQLELKEKITQSIDADWFIHHDADEIRFAPQEYKSLQEGITDVDDKGFNAINFDEFVFLPTSRDESFEETDYVNQMQYYYYFSPKKFRRVNAWKNGENKIDLISSGGHHVNFKGIKIYEKNFIMRHYIFLSYAHACNKYGLRTHEKSELKRGWHIERDGFSPDKVLLPDKNQLKKALKNCELDTSDPWTHHRFFGENKASYFARKAFHKLFNFS
jgi:glycosyltransferase involved in cell wall biosynthesis